MVQLVQLVLVLVLLLLVLVVVVVLVSLLLLLSAKTLRSSPSQQKNAIRACLKGELGTRVLCDLGAGNCSWVLRG